MKYGALIKLYHLGFGALLLVAILIQFLTFRQTPINFFSYFTVLSNFLVSFVLLAPFFNKLNYKNFDQIRGAATLYILLTGFGFTVLLAGKNEEFLFWPNIVVHYISPIIMLIDWILIPSVRISFKNTFPWIGLLLLYFIYSMVRGYFTGWYPYNFLNPSEVGISGLIIYVGIILISSLVISFLVTRLSTGKHISN